MDTRQALLRALTEGAHLMTGDDLNGFDGIEGTGFSVETETEFAIIDVQATLIRVEVYNIDTGDLESVMVLKELS